MQCGSSSPLIWRSLSSIFGCQSDVTGSTSHRADDFAAFFATKIADIWNDTAGLPPPPVISQAPSSLMSFRQYTEAEVWHIVIKSPIKSCSMDPVPTFLLHEFIVARPRRCLTLSHPVPWQNWMAVYLGCTLRMKTLFRGWPVMAHETQCSASFDPLTGQKYTRGGTTTRSVNTGELLWQ